uniref:Uncharacterized protein n=1 Tax=Anguilla anguilla TaxID=7936 RepID=A0A0E9VND3_ANGAN
MVRGINLPSKASC